jgi:hypothetical protein
MSQEVDQALENSLKFEMKARYGDKFIGQKWKKRKFGFYTDNADFPKIDVLDATLNVAANLELTIPKKYQRNLQSNVTLDSTPEDVLPAMSETIDAGT